MSNAVVLAPAAATLMGARLVLLGALHAVRSPYHPVRHAVSDYAVGRTRPLATVMTSVTAIAWALLAAATWFDLPTWGGRATATLMLAAVAVLTALLPFAPTDLEGQRLTRRGLVHYGLAIASFALSYSVTGDISRMAGSTSGWSPFSGVLGLLHQVALVSLIGVCVTLLPRLRKVFGLLERVFLVSIAAFYLVFAVGLAVA